MQVSIRGDLREARRSLRLQKEGVKKAAFRSINDTIRTVRAEGAREIKRSHPALKIGLIKAEMVVVKAHRNRLEARVEVSGRPTSALLWSPSRVKRGITIKFGQRRILATYKGRKAFIVDKWGGEVYVRRNPTGRQLRRFRGPSLPGVFRAQRDKYQQIARRRWPVVFRQRLQYEIHRAERQARARASAPSGGALTSFVERQFRLPGGALG